MINKFYSQRQQMGKRKKIEPPFITYIKKLDKKLNLLGILDKVMPVVILGTGMILSSFVYLGKIATFPSAHFKLPKTGDSASMTENLIILYPEHYTNFQLPEQLIALSVDGFYINGEIVTFFAQKTGQETTQIGRAIKSQEEGTYEATWNNAESGRYMIWVEVQNTDNSKAMSQPIVVDIQK